jgi:hypothetical protein
MTRKLKRLNNHLHPQFLKKRSLGKTAICTLCGEAYPARDGSSCLACQGETPYTEVIKMKRESNNRTGSQDIRKISFS